MTEHSPKAQQPIPGPWRAAPYSSIVGTGVVGPRGMMVARIPGAKEHAEPISKLVAAAWDMKAILDELEEAFDKEIYPEQQKDDFDAPDDREYSVTITAKQWQAIGRAISKAEHG